MRKRVITTQVPFFKNDHVVVDDNVIISNPNQHENNFIIPLQDSTAMPCSGLNICITSSISISHLVRQIHLHGSST